MPRGLMVGLLSAFVGLVWFVLLIVWWAFWSEDHTVAMRFAVAIRALMLLAIVMAIIWLPYTAIWGTREERRAWDEPGLAPRALVSCGVFLVLGAVSSNQLYHEWRDFNLCQSLVVILVALIAAGILMAPVWMGWDQRRSW